MDTVGDAYVVAGFLPPAAAAAAGSAGSIAAFAERGDWDDGADARAARVCESLLQMGEVILRELAAYRRETGAEVHGRVGIAVGPALLAALGRLQPRIHALGAGMRAADALEQSGRPGAVHVSEDFMRLLFLSRAAPSPHVGPAVSVVPAGSWASPAGPDSEPDGGGVGSGKACVGAGSSVEGGAARTQAQPSGSAETDKWRVPSGWRIQESRLHQVPGQVGPAARRPSHPPAKAQRRLSAAARPRKSRTSLSGLIPLPGGGGGGGGAGINVAGVGGGDPARSRRSMPATPADDAAAGGGSGGSLTGAESPWSPASGSESSELANLSEAASEASAAADAADVGWARSWTSFVLILADHGGSSPLSCTGRRGRLLRPGPAAARLPGTPR
jgi:hypothetical protein